MKKIVLFISIIIILTCKSCVYDEIKENKGKTVAIITNKLRGSKGGYTLVYKYTVNDTIYKGNDAIKIYKCNFENTFKGKYFPVVYSTINPEKCILLLSSEDFAQWDYRFPDSLRG